MKRAYIPKPGVTGSNPPVVVSLDNDFDNDDSLLDDPDDDLICSQIMDIPIQEASCSYGSSPATPQFKVPNPPPPIQTPSVYRPGQKFASPSTASANQNVKSAEAMQDRLIGENSMLRERLEIAKKHLREAIEDKQRVENENQSTMNADKEKYVKELAHIRSELDFKDHSSKQLKMRNIELEHQLKLIKSQLDSQAASKPLPYSLPIVMHRILDFSSNRGFVDWDETVTMDDVPD